MEAQKSQNQVGIRTWESFPSECRATIVDGPVDLQKCGNPKEIQGLNSIEGGVHGHPRGKNIGIRNIFFVKENYYYSAILIQNRDWETICNFLGALRNSKASLNFQ